MFKDLVTKNRSYRRFFEDRAISRQTLLELVDCARLAPSGGNRQALKFYISCEKDQNEKIYPTLVWAAYLKDWGGPPPGERPAGYVVLLQDESYKAGSPLDPGIAAQTILLAAAEIGLGGCMIANVKRDELSAALKLPAGQEILLVIALGTPKETVVLDELGPDGDIKYWRDEAQVHHVPKRKLEDMILG
jgi:nitroreductase